MRNIYARDEQGELIKKISCQRPTCSWPNWHICLDKTDPEHTKVHALTVKRALSREQRERATAAQRERRAKEKQVFQKRDEEIVRLYNEGEHGMLGISKLTSTAYTTVNKILKRAQSEGKVTIRSRGTILAYSS